MSNYLRFWYVIDALDDDGSDRRKMRRKYYFRIAHSEPPALQIHTSRTSWRSFVWYLEIKMKSIQRLFDQDMHIFYVMNITWIIHV